MKIHLLFITIFFLPILLPAQTANNEFITEEIDSLIQLTRALTSNGEFDKALELISLAEENSLEKLGRETVSYASAHFNHGRVLHFKGDIEQAISLYEESLDTWKKIPGEPHIYFVGNMINLGLLYREAGRFEQAEPLLLKSQAFAEKTLEKSHAYYTIILNQLAILYQDMGKPEKAEPLYREELAVEGQSLGKEHEDYAATINNLATLLMETGKYEQAEPLYLEAKNIQEKTLGTKHPDYAATLNNLANLYWQLGNFENAEPLYLKALDIREKELGKAHPDYTQSLDNLAALYQKTGNFGKAEQLYLEALTIQEKTQDRAPLDYSSRLSNLGVLYLKTRNFEKAEPLFLKALEIEENTFGKERADYATYLNNLAELYRKTGSFEKANKCGIEALDVLGKTLGKTHPDYSNTLHSLADLYKDMGDFEKAEPLYLEALAVWEKSLGKEHPLRAVGLSGLADLQQKMGDFEKEALLLEELAGLNQTLISKAVRHLSERELNNYLLVFSESQDKILSFARFYTYQTTGLRGAFDNGRSLALSVNHIPQVCYDNCLFYKGFLLHSAQRIKQLALSDSVATEKFNLLKSYHRRLAAQYALPLSDRKNTEELEAQADALEKELARTIAGFGEALQQVHWQDVQQALLPGEAALEFVHFRYYGKEPTDSILYAALLLLPDEKQPIFLTLFEEEQLALLRTHGERKADYVSNLYTIPERGVKPYSKRKKPLYEIIWKPLEKELEGVTTIYYSPSGLLHRLNLGAIPIPTEGGQGGAQTLADRYRLVELGSTRQLVASPILEDNIGTNAVLFGGIKYNLDSTSVSQVDLNISTGALAKNRGYSETFGIRFAFSDSSYRDNTWDNLPWSETEIAALEPILESKGIETTVFKGFAATEEAFKGLDQFFLNDKKGQGDKKESPRMLHIATHGFFFPDPTPQGGTGAELPLGDGGEPVFQISDHPMIRSGLIFAGGNHAWKTGRPYKPRLEDGILTAYEISQMNLSNTELVVLSACETGLGDIQGNEGVYGLQRAFKIAGAKYLIMSLWQVPDQETSIFMTAFYRNWLESNMTIPDAFRATQKEMRERFIRPFQWAGYVLVE